jgi:hypothetical protein
MGNEPASASTVNAVDWARRCRVEAARAAHPSTKAFLLELASEFEAIAGEVVVIDPDDHELQSAVADRLYSLAAKTKAWVRH